VLVITYTHMHTLAGLSATFHAHSLPPHLISPSRHNRVGVGHATDPTTTELPEQDPQQTEGAVIIVYSTQFYSLPSSFFCNLTHPITPSILNPPTHNRVGVSHPHGSNHNRVTWAGPL